MPGIRRSKTTFEFVSESLIAWVYCSAASWLKPAATQSFGSSCVSESGLTPQPGVTIALARISGEPRYDARSNAAAAFCVSFGTTKIQPPKPAKGARFGSLGVSQAPFFASQYWVAPGNIAKPTLPLTTDVFGSMLIGPMSAHWMLSAAWPPTNAWALAAQS